jgi:hypothetical protein
MYTGLMKKLIILFLFLPSLMFAQAQVTPSTLVKVANATTIFGMSLPVGTQVYDILNDKLYIVKTGIISTATITTAAASLSLNNTGGATGDSKTDNATANATTSSSTDAVLASITTSTSGNADYLVMYSGGFFGDTASGGTTCVVQLFNGATAIGTQLTTPPTTVPQPFSSSAIITGVASGTVISIEWHSGTNLKTSTCVSASLTIIRIK